MTTEGRAKCLSSIYVAVIPVLLIGVSIGWLDRPLSTWSHQHLHDVAVFVWMTQIVEPLPLVAVAGLAVIAAAVVAGWRPGPRSRVLLACCLAVLVAGAIKEELKFVFGRTWPETWVNGNPSWIGNGTFTFSAFHGGRGWASFPSGHTSVMAAPMAVLWQSLPQWRWLWSVPVIIVACGLLGADYHWLSDIIAGGCVGAATGAGMVALIEGRN
jgi:membrane-associated phospholipid phosphatase